jgi:hypothetical protein
MIVVEWDYMRSGNDVEEGGGRAGGEYIREV